MADDDISKAWEYIIDAAVLSAYVNSDMKPSSTAASDEYLERGVILSKMRAVFLANYTDMRVANALIERFVSMGFIVRIDDRFVSDYYHFNAKLVDYYKARTQDLTTPLGKMGKIGSKFMEQAINNIFEEFSVEDLLKGCPRGASDSVVDSENRTAPTADGFVALDHNSEPCQQAVGAIDAAIEAVRADNEYGERDNEDRDQRVAELKAGAELLKSNRVEVSKIEAVLIKTLAYLTKIAVAVKECAIAIKAVKALFGL